MFRTLSCWSNEHIPHLLRLFPDVAHVCICEAFRPSSTTLGPWTSSSDKTRLMMYGFNPSVSNIPTDGMQIVEIRLEYPDKEYWVEIDMLHCKITQKIGTSRADYDNLVPLMEIRDAGFDVREYVVKQ